MTFPKLRLLVDNLPSFHLFCALRKPLISVSVSLPHPYYLLVSSLSPFPCFYFSLSLSIYLPSFLVSRPLGAFLSPSPSFFFFSIYLPSLSLSPSCLFSIPFLPAFLFFYPSPFLSLMGSSHERFFPTRSRRQLHLFRFPRLQCPLNLIGRKYKRTINTKF